MRNRNRRLGASRQMSHRSTVPMTPSMSNFNDASPYNHGIQGMSGMFEAGDTGRDVNVFSPSLNGYGPSDGMPMLGGWFTDNIVAPFKDVYDEILGSKTEEFIGEQTGKVKDPVVGDYVPPEELLRRQIVRGDIPAPVAGAPLAPVQKPFWQNPLVLGGAALAAVTLLT